MAQDYACMNYGSCANAGVPQSGSPGTPPMCPGCGNLMTAQGRVKRQGGGGNVAKIIGLTLLGVMAIFLAWQVVMWGYHRTVGYDIIGRWRAVTTSVAGVAIPVGVNIDFAADSATILDTKLRVIGYEREGKRVHVVLEPDQRAQIGLTFVFEDQDHMAFEGPLGVSLRYRRIKGAAQ